MSKFDYKKAEADLYDAGARHPEEVSEYRSEKAFRGYMKEHGLNPDHYYGNQDASEPSGTEPEGCFLTSACVEARGLPDDCEELQTLRHFRDQYLAHRPGGAQDIQEYYRTAPGIVNAVNSRPDRKEIWDRLYTELVLPCVRMIHQGKNEEAYLHYRQYTLNLASQVGC